MTPKWMSVTIARNNKLDGIGCSERKPRCDRGHFFVCPPWAPQRISEFGKVVP
jgi:hypothetical protein